MTDLLDKHSEDWDPDALVEIGDAMRKAEKESGLGEHLAEARAVEQHQEEKHARRGQDALDKILPPPEELFDPFTGEVIERDDLTTIKLRLAAVEGHLESEHDKNRRFYEARRLLRQRHGELVPVDLPRRSQQTEKQAKVERCPKCRTRLPRVFFEEPEA